MVTYHAYCTADLHLCFCICKKHVSAHIMTLLFISSHFQSRVLLKLLLEGIFLESVAHFITGHEQKKFNQTKIESYQYLPRSCQY